MWGGSKDCEHSWNSREFNLHSGRGDNVQKNGKYSELETISDKKLKDNSCSKCGAWRGQLGLEPIFKLYIDHLVGIFGEVKRVLKSSGSFYLNIGDTYSGSGCGYGDKRGTNKREETLENIKLYQSIRKPQTSMNLPSKCLIGIPERLMLRLVDEQGWIRRNTIIWHKPNCMPSSVRDRRSNSYEPIFHFVKSQRYYYDLDSIRIPHLTTVKRVKEQNSNSNVKGEDNNLLTDYSQNSESKSESLANTGANNKEPYKKNNPHLMRLKQDNIPGRNAPTYKGFNEGGKNPGDFLNISTRGYKEAHFAVYPEALVHPFILSSSPKDGVVLDPFSGSGTTAKVAKDLGRNSISIDINTNYAELWRKRLKADESLTPEDYTVEVER